MRIELLVVADCPNEEAARAVIRDAAALAGLPEPGIVTTIVGTDEHARAVGFAGSPTIRIDGRDPYPVPAGTLAGVTCRVYPGGIPDIAVLQAALVRAASSPATAGDGR